MILDYEKFKIVFDSTTLEKIVYNPSDILENEQDFWENERAQQCTKLWAKNVQYEINYDEWRGKMKDWASIPENKRKNHIFLKNAQRIIEGKEVFLKKALPHLFSYSPNGSIENYDVTIQFTAFIPARAFAMEDIVINVAAPYWNDNPDNIFNALIHELFHCCYSWCNNNRKGGNLEDNILESMLINFQSEGICTYVGYKALSLFPSPDEKDYSLLANKSVVNRLIREVNSVFSNVRKLSNEELQKLAWDKCVVGRGYYVVGAYMCQVIEKESDRASLLETLVEGPQSWLKLYNSLVEEKITIQIEL
jgi:hypothetical protein